MNIDEGSEETPGGGEKVGGERGGGGRSIKFKFVPQQGTPSVQEKQKKGRG